MVKYRLVQRILSTNTLLVKIKIQQDDKCSFCNSVPETLIHLFWSCPLIQTFWQSLQELLRKECNHIRHIYFNVTEIIHDCNRAVDILNFIILLAKQYIYRMKYIGIIIPDVQSFKKIVICNYNLEKCLVFRICEWTRFNQKWSSYKTF